MGLFDSLPGRPLQRSQIERLERTDAVNATHAIYSNQQQDTAYGLVILLNGTLRAWAYSDTNECWRELETKELEEPDGEFDDHESVEAFRDRILDELNAVLL